MTCHMSVEEHLPTVKKFSKNINPELDDIGEMKASYEGQQDKSVFLQLFAVADVEKLLDLTQLMEVKKRELDIHIIKLMDI
jgi:hypothetical protein